MATFQLFFQSGRAKDLSAPLYFMSTSTVNFEFKFMRHGEDGGDINTRYNFEGEISNKRFMNRNF
jgi:hypothetical protein